MTNHIDEATSLFEGGTNCAQAVFAAFCDVTDIERTTALKISSGFGGGIGGTQGFCGALLGAVMALSAKNGYTEGVTPEQKKAYYKSVQKLIERFNKEYGSTLCAELEPEAKSRIISTGENGEIYHKRPCAVYVRRAAELLDDFLQPGA